MDKSTTTHNPTEPIVLIEQNRLRMPMNMDDERTHIIYNVTKETIIEGTLEYADDFMRMLESKGVLYRASVSMLFDGYNDDPREVFEIDEIRKWSEKLINRYPHVLYFLTDDSKRLLLSSVCDINTFYFGEKKPYKEWLSMGIEPSTDLPKHLLELKIDSNMSKFIKKSLKRFGKKIGDQTAAYEFAEWMETNLFTAL